MTHDWDAMALVGRVARPHGTRGQVVVNPETDFPEERFRVGATVHARRSTDVVRLVVSSVRFHRGRPIVGFEGVVTIEDAEALRDAELSVPEDELTELPRGTYYRHELTGCSVETVDGRLVGRVVRVEGVADYSWLVVDPPGGARGDTAAEVLVPLSGPVCVTIDPVARRIVIDPPPGLLDLNAPAGDAGAGARASGP